MSVGRPVLSSRAWEASLLQQRGSIAVIDEICCPVFFFLSRVNKICASVDFL